MNDGPETFECDDGAIRIHGFRVAEIRRNGVALIAVGCDAENCRALHFHILVEEEDGSLWFVTHLSTVDDKAVTRSTLLFRAISKLVFDNYDVENVKPGQEAESMTTKWIGTDIIPGLTPWGKG